jgi:hypothetical protein
MMSITGLNAKLPRSGPVYGGGAVSPPFMIWTRTEFVLRFIGARGLFFFAGFFAGLFSGFFSDFFAATGFFLGGIVVYFYQIKFFVDLAGGAVKEHKVELFVEYEAA